jgi:hypothetical protein
MTPKPQSAAVPAGDAGFAVRPSDSGPFVINLCSSTTPMALVQPQAPELKRFTFFMSRRREDGRERFRLHMGYFVTAAEADEWLAVVREIFPAAWVGEAPGKRLRERQAAAQDAARPAVAPVAAPPTRASQPSRANGNGQDPARALAPVRVPTVQPAVRAVPSPARPVAARAPAARPTPPRSVTAPARASAPASPPTTRPAVGQPASNVREVLAQLDAATPTRAQAPAPSISDTQVLRILEERDLRRDDSATDEHRSIELLSPDDSGTRRALREAVAENRPVTFAVQLQWSVQPIDLASVPPLAIFSAYTLYTVEGNRDGRKWYGLRLGFFSDAISAKQVAYYVRSDFASVAVVPVSQQERARAQDEERQSPQNARPIPVKNQTAEEFKLLDDHDPPMEAVREAPRPTPKPAAALRPKPAAVRPAVARAPGSVQGRAKSRPQTLEETLEILGASQLEIDESRGDVINETGVRHLKVEVRKNTAFTRLIDRLTERMTKP